MGCLFLLVSTIFSPDISGFLINLQQWTVTPPFWNLPVVLSAVRIIFMIAGAFLTLFGIGTVLMKRGIFRN